MRAAFKSIRKFNCIDLIVSIVVSVRSKQSLKVLYFLMGSTKMGTRGFSAAKTEVSLGSKRIVLLESTLIYKVFVSDF